MLSSLKVRSHRYKNLSPLGMKKGGFRKQKFEGEKRKKATPSMTYSGLSKKMKRYMCFLKWASPFDMLAIDYTKELSNHKQSQT